MWTLLISLAIGSVPAEFRTLINDPMSTLQADTLTPGGFRIVALSNASEACVNLVAAQELSAEEGSECGRRLTDAAIRLRPWDTSIAEAELGEHGLYLSHLGVVLASYDTLVGDSAHEATWNRVVTHLNRKAMAHKTGNPRSYPKSKARWPADGAVTLAALHRYDLVHGTELHVVPLRRWLANFETQADAPSQLHRSELTGAFEYSPLPRGCALNWTVRYLAPMDFAAATDLWSATVAGHLVTVGPITGMREWPRGVDGPADIDSGPIVMGVGAAASAFAIGASRAVADEGTYRRLEATEQRVRNLAQLVGGDLAAASTSALATAIGVNQHSQFAVRP